MNQLFEPITFTNKPIVWNYSTKSTNPVKAFYHWHQCCEVLYIYEGSGTVVVNHQTYVIKKGMLFFFQPFELHKVFPSIMPNTPYRRTVIHLDPVILESYLQSFPRRCNFFTQLWKSSIKERSFNMENEFNSINSYFHSYEQAMRKGVGSSQEEITFFMLQLLTSIQAACQNEAENKHLEHRSERYSELIMRWLEAHYTEEFVLDQLAAELHLSKYHVSRVFRNETGSSITEYLTARRIKQACHLLETSTLSVEQIGAKVGLNNTSHFIHMFKKVVGVTPLKYRNSY
ncbi:AraC family transcriptional regulator [Ectobacillus funiculus]|uniref:helix-turn-helix domain-containing protein n=1 Tax=Ectobacillus funiculus TaxID=137993 RepID=UPI00397D85E6